MIKELNGLKNSIMMPIEHSLAQITQFDFIIIFFYVLSYSQEISNDLFPPDSERIKPLSINIGCVDS